jgi:hypothetical protein
MKYFNIVPMKLFVALVFLWHSLHSLCQVDKLHLKNALIVGQMDKSEDRYTLEINLTELLSESGIQALPSLNMQKMGSDPVLLSSDSIQGVLKQKGIDTYILVSVRGYDKNFKRSQGAQSLLEALGSGNLFPIYREDVTSVTFEFLFFREGKFVAADLLKCGNVSDKDSVIKRFRKRMEKKIKTWK